jgi:FkbM family methyltransferase
MRLRRAQALLPGWLGSVVRSIRLTAKTGRLHLVRRRGGVLTYRYPGGVYTVRGLASPRELDLQTHDVFLWRYVPRPGDVVVDCGAGLGSELLTLARLVRPSGRVIAIEAHPPSFAKLQLLTRLNELENVDLIHVALTDRAGTARISDLRNEQANSIVAADATGLDVPADRLDAVLARLGIGEVDLLKMNIEGAETLALRGLGSSLGGVRHLVVACHDFAAGRGAEAMRTKADVRELLERAGFDVRARDDRRYWIADYLYALRPDGTDP